MHLAVVAVSYIQLWSVQAVEDAVIPPGAERMPPAEAAVYIAAYHNRPEICTPPMQWVATVCKILVKRNRRFHALCKFVHSDGLIDWGTPGERKHSLCPIGYSCRPQLDAPATSRIRSAFYSPDTDRPRIACAPWADVPGFVSAPSTRGPRYRPRAPTASRRRPAITAFPSSNGNQGSADRADEADRYGVSSSARVSSSGTPRVAHRRPRRPRITNAASESAVTPGTAAWLPIELPPDTLQAEQVEAPAQPHTAPAEAVPHYENEPLAGQLLWPPTLHDPLDGGLLAQIAVRTPPADADTGPASEHVAQASIQHEDDAELANAGWDPWLDLMYDVDWASTSTPAATAVTGIDFVDQNWRSPQDGL